MGLSLTAVAGLQPVQMSILKPGAVTAAGWLKGQLENQKAGLTGHAEEIYDDLGKSDWLTLEEKGGDYAWERGPYYAKGLLALAYALNDGTLKARAGKWAEAYFAGQRENGDFGPRRDNWWANMLVLHFMRDWCEATGDERAVTFLERYFRYQKKALEEKPFGADSVWAACRGGDELEVVLWLYDRTGSQEWLEFAELVRGQTCDWAEWYADSDHLNIFPCGRTWDAFQVHIVNLNQGLKNPALSWRLTGSDLHRQGWNNATSPEGWLMKKCGRADGMVNGTEAITDRSTTQGTELCAQAERILSDQVCLSVFGDAAIGDDMETIAYNTLPATLHPYVRGMRYYNILNMPMCVSTGSSGDGGYWFGCNAHASAMAPGPESGYGCCRSNFHFAWPKFVQSLWMGQDNGLVATAYGPCNVAARGFALREETEYPFRDTIKVTVDAAPAGAACLAFRIPKWTTGANVAVNGTAVNGAVPGTFLRIEREWQAGDVVTLEFPAKLLACRTGVNDSAYVKRGALLFAWNVPSIWAETVGGIGDFKKYEIIPTSNWNVALILPEEDELPWEIAYPETFPANPFDPATPPVKLVTMGFRTYAEGWGTFIEGSMVRAKEPPQSPQPQTDMRTGLELVPLGSTQVRITYFPWGRR